MRRRSHFMAFGLLELFLELVNFSLELELLKLGGELLHIGVLQSSIDGGGLTPLGGMTYTSSLALDIVSPGA
jgi:hypothetical protein